MTAFNDIAEQLLGKNAGELKRLKDTEPQQFEDWVAERQFKRYVMTMRAKEEQHGQSKVVVLVRPWLATTG